MAGSMFFVHDLATGQKSIPLNRMKAENRVQRMSGWKIRKEGSRYWVFNANNRRIAHFPTKAKALSFLQQQTHVRIKKATATRRK